MNLKFAPGINHSLSHTKPRASNFNHSKIYSRNFEGFNACSSSYINDDKNENQADSHGNLKLTRCSNHSLTYTKQTEVNFDHLYVSSTTVMVFLSSS